MWVEDGSIDTRSKKFQNMRHLPLLQGEPDKLVLDLVAIPELHLVLSYFLVCFSLKLSIFYLGVPDKLIFELKRNVFDDKKSGQDFMTAFYKKVKIKSKDC